MNKKSAFSLTILSVFLCIGLSGCDNDSSAGPRPPQPGLNNGTDANNTGTDTGSGTGTIVNPTDPNNNDGAECANTLTAIIRDFSATHPDFERPDYGWGPAKGMVQSTLGPNDKPVFNALHGTHQVVDPNCGATCPLGGFLHLSQQNPTGDQWGSIPMWEGNAYFHQWYTDVEGVNLRFERKLLMGQTDTGSYVYDDSAFFPLGTDEGFGHEGLTDEFGNLRNFLFTTEIAVEFKYEQGQVFTFRGDDDLWIFVNRRLALDLGGLHWPFQGTINFDAKAQELGIEPGGVYPMHIFHAERHTEQSNFRVETNINCFTNIIIM